MGAAATGSTTLVKTPIARALASVIATLALLAVPPAAFAEEEGIWSQWAAEVTDRESKYEVPFAILVSIPGMIVITPLWLGRIAIAKLRGDE